MAFELQCGRIVRSAVEAIVANVAICDGPLKGFKD